MKPLHVAACARYAVIDSLEVSELPDGSAARLVVDPGKVLQLKQGIEDELGHLRDWLHHNTQRLGVVPPPGLDPCSRHAADAFGHNGSAALAAADGYLIQLRNLVTTLEEIARAYGLTDQDNAGKFPR